MSLRLRLIFAFFLFSVVPLGSRDLLLVHEQSARPARRGAARNGVAHGRADAAHAGGDDADQRARRGPHGHPTMTDAPTGTSGQTARSSTRTVARSEGRPQPRARPFPLHRPRPRRLRPRPPRPPRKYRSRDRSATIEGQVAGALGEVAMLLNNVEVRGLGRSADASAHRRARLRRAAAAGCRRMPLPPKPRFARAPCRCHLLRRVLRRRDVGRRPRNAIPRRRRPRPVRLRTLQDGRGTASVADAEARVRTGRPAIRAFRPGPPGVRRRPAHRDLRPTIRRT